MRPQHFIDDSTTSGCVAKKQNFTKYQQFIFSRNSFLAMIVENEIAKLPK